MKRIGDHAFKDQEESVNSINRAEFEGAKCF